MKKNIWIVALLLFLMLVISACSSSDTANQNANTNENAGMSGNNEGDANEPYEIKIYTFQNGSSTYLFGVLLADLINENSDFLRAEALESPGTVEVTQMLINDESLRPHVVAFMNPDEAAVGYPPFEEPYTGFRILAAYGLQNNGFITTNPDIQTLADLEGKRVAVGTQPSSVRVDLPIKTLDKMGIENVQYEYMTINAGHQAILDGQVDALLTGGFAVDPTGEQWLPNPAMLQVLSQADHVGFLSYDEDALKAVADELGGIAGQAYTIPPQGIAENQTDPYVVAAKIIGWYADQSLPDNVAKEFVRIMAENVEEFHKVHESGKYISLETMGRTGYDQSGYHPGAWEYYMENGIDTSSPYPD
jgi:TRAP transporter TAXI family solute receptor